MNQARTNGQADPKVYQENASIDTRSNGNLTETANQPAALPLISVDREKGLIHRPKRSRWKWLILIVVTGIVVGGVARYQWGDGVFVRQSKTVPSRQPAITKIVALGRLEPEGEVIEVAGPSGSGDARLQSLEVDVGDKVAKGQVLAVLDNYDQLRTQQLVAQSQIEQASARLKQTRLIASTTFDQLHASLESLKSKRETARSDLRRQEQLRKTNASSAQEYEATSLAWTNADKAVAEAVARLNRYTENPDDSVDVQVARADILVAEAALQNATSQLERSFIRAPIAGKVLAIDLRPGERVSQQALLRMGNTDAMLVRVEVYENDVARIFIGQPASIHAIALASPLHGVVEKVTTLVQRQSVVDSDPAANTDARVVDVFVRISQESTDEAARFVGMQVSVEFPL